MHYFIVSQFYKFQQVYQNQYFCFSSVNAQNMKVKNFQKWSRDQNCEEYNVKKFKKEHKNRNHKLHDQLKGVSGY